MTLDVLAHVRSRFGHLFDDVCRLIIRPERAVYTLADLGPKVFRLGEDSTEKFARTDLELVNMRGLRIQCSWYAPVESARLPCVIYLHGNCGSRCDGLETLFLLRHGFTLFTFDACGSGMSDGEFVSLGFYERQDLAAVVDYLLSVSSVTAIGLWGRSMGAVTSIMYASKDPTIKFVVGDSPFSSLRVLCADLVEQHGSWVPKQVVKAVVGKIRKKICKVAGFDLNDLDCAAYARRCDVPAFLFHGGNDTFVLPRHSLEVANQYRGSCVHKIVEGDHNSRRSADAVDTAVALLRLYLVDKVEHQQAVVKAKCAQDENAAQDLVQPGCPSQSPNSANNATETSIADGDGAEDDEEILLDKLITDSGLSLS